MSETEHWERVYSSKPIEKLGWYEPHLRTSLTWIQHLGLAKDAPIIDVGGGASTLVDDLLSEGYNAVTVLDLSGSALALTKARLGEGAASVTWLEGDITSVDLPMKQYQLWHDRAVFHFLTAPEQQRTYRGQLLKALQPAGHLIMGMFTTEAPPKCSGLPLKRYSLEEIEKTMGEPFKLRQHLKELHVTPGGVEQMYIYCHFQRRQQSIE